MINWFKRFSRTNRVAAAALSSMVASTSAHSGQPPKTLLESVPARWQTLLVNACQASPSNEGATAEVYFSDSVGSRKLLLLDADGSYQLMYWRDEEQSGRLYTGAFQRNDERIKLDMKLNWQSLGSDTNDELLVPMRLGAQRVLLLEKHLNDIGAMIQWRGLLGDSEDYFVEARCDHPLPAFELDGPKAPPRSELPDALKHFVFEQPVETKIIALLEDSRSYDYAARDAEFLVRVDKGDNDLFRINMPLCSPRHAGQHWKGWVGTPLADSTEVRIVIREAMQGRPLVFPQVGQVLTTSAAQCDSADSD